MTAVFSGLAEPGQHRYRPRQAGVCCWVFWLFGTPKRSWPGTFPDILKAVESVWERFGELGPDPASNSFSAS